LGAFITLLPSYGSSVLKVDPKFIGPLVIAPAGIGMVLSALFLNSNRRTKLNKNRIMAVGFFIVGIALILFSFYSFYRGLSFAFPILIFSVVAMGFGVSFVQIPGQTLLHEKTDEDKRGKVFGLSSMQLRLATSLPALVVGGVADLTSPLITMILLSVIVFLYSLTLVFD
jgi:sugar phosphate permease